MRLSVCQEQLDVFAFLQDPRTHGRTEPVIRIDTHGAAVFLAGPDVYKVKRAVHFPFMDFSTLEKRHAACEAEISVNRGNAPDLYIGVVPITRHADVLRLGGSAKPSSGRSIFGASMKPLPLITSRRTAFSALS